MATLTRFDNQYKDIEKFKDFELTQCIAYEMAIRNPERKKLQEEYLKQSFTKNIDKWIDRFNNIETDEEFKALILEFIKVEGINNTIVEENDKLQYAIEEKSFFSPRRESDIKLLNDVIITYLLRDSQRKQASNSAIIDSDSLTESIMNDDGTTKTIHNGIINYEKLFPKFTRPHPVIPKNMSKEIDIKVNLKLPAKELLAYVEVIKKNYDASNGEAFQAATLLTTTAEIDREIFSIQIKMKRKGSKSKLEMPEKTQQEVYADLFFLYDVYRDGSIKKQNDKYNYFCDKLLTYYTDKVCRYHGISDKEDVYDSIGTPNEHYTRQYLKVMKGYIDQYAYKSLLA